MHHARRNITHILENPGWYTQYTPYQSEISQGRLEALINFQTLVCDLTSLPVSNASLLDEATAAAEAMALVWRETPNSPNKVFYVAQDCHPQTISVVKTRAEPLGIEIKLLASDQMTFEEKPFGILLQYPGTEGRIIDYTSLIQTAHDHGALVTVATDLLALTIFKITR